MQNSSITTCALPDRQVRASLTCSFHLAVKPATVQRGYIIAVPAGTRDGDYSLKWIAAAKLAQMALMDPAAFPITYPDLVAQIGLDECLGSLVNVE